MKFTDKYAKASDKAEDKVNKTVLSDDAYAIGELLEQINAKLVRLSFR